jgi:hypothetical protein
MLHGWGPSGPSTKVESILGEIFPNLLELFYLCSGSFKDFLHFLRQFVFCLNFPALQQKTYLLLPELQAVQFIGLPTTTGARSGRVGVPPEPGPS